MTVTVQCSYCAKETRKRTDHLKVQMYAYCSRTCAALGRTRADAVWPSHGPTRNRAAQKAYHVGYQRKKRQRINELSTRWRATNHDKRLAVQKAWRDRNRDKIATLARNRRGAKMAGGRPVDFEAIMQRDQMICHVCKHPVTKATLHFDHVIPLAAGGAHSQENIAVAHARCNQRKGTRVLTLF